MGTAYAVWTGIGAVGMAVCSLVLEPDHLQSAYALGQALIALGRLAAADSLLARCVALAPHLPPIAVRAAEFFGGTGDRNVELKLAAAAIGRSKDEDVQIFARLEKEKFRASDILAAGMPADAAAAEDLLRRKMTPGTAPTSNPAPIATIAG